MTVAKLHKHLKKLIDEGYADAHIIKLEDFDEYSPETYGVFAPTDFAEHTCFGREFPNKSKQFVFLDFDGHVQNKFSGFAKEEE